jgi:uncharacterized repeat protein (TIGR04042 family)
MPALNFEIEWPNGEITECYSPSTIVLQYFQDGDTFTIDELKGVSRTALNMAAKRVKERFGFECVSAVEQRDKILRNAACFGSGETVRILNIQEHSS